MVDISSEVAWIPIWESVPVNTSTLPISYHRATISLHLLLNERQESFIPIFYHSEAMVVMPWQRAYPSQQSSFKQNTHSFSGWMVKALLFSNRSVSLTLSRVFLPTVSQGQGQEKSIHYSHLLSNLPSLKLSSLFSPFLTRAAHLTKKLKHNRPPFLQVLFVFYIKDRLVSNKSE